MTENDFRELALSLPETEEKSNMNHPDFRVGGKIFATLGGKPNMGMVKLTPEQQEEFMLMAPSMFEPASGKWGLQGATMVRLANADVDNVKSAIATAWQNVSMAAKK